ncbi:histidine phosphatase family protein [Streptomyces sp. NPDC050560]|uniref:histidine phosphatase family protein n=1 Tax=Streptomyces sp. NPDC050560 TaxID=3365630 RepID=UPI0037BB431B
MTTRVTLVSAAASTALATAAFEDGHPLTPEGRAAAERAACRLPAAGRAAASGTVRCAETAAALGLEAAPLPALAGRDVGAWRGRTLDALAAAEPAAVSCWLAEPGFAPPGGEPLTALCARVSGWLAGLPTGRALAVVEPDVVRAALVTALELPAAAFWRLDVRPLTATVLTGREGRWNALVGSPL